MWLQVFLSGPPPDARVWTPDEVDRVRRGSEEFYDRSVENDGRMRIRVDVHEGDTLASIATRYGISSASLARINHRSRRDALTAGEQVVVYVPRTHGDGSSESGAAPSSSSSSSAAPAGEATSAETPAQPVSSGESSSASPRP
jgi:hypothetical protein